MAAVRSDIWKRIVTNVTTPRTQVNVSLYAPAFDIHLALCLKNADIVSEVFVYTLASADSSHIILFPGSFFIS